MDGEKGGKDMSERSYFFVFLGGKGGSWEDKVREMQPRERGWRLVREKGGDIKRE